MGFPLGINHKVSDFKLVVDKVVTKIESWKSKSLSWAGKVTLINSVCTPIVAYYMHCLYFPKTVCNLIDKAFRNFLWNDHLGNKKLHLINWSIICSSKKEGGLGIFRSHERNMALLAKLYWRVISEDLSCWNQVCKYRLSLKSCSNSHLGKCLLMGKSLVEKGSYKIISSGATSSFWFDSWTPLGPLRGAIAGPLLNHEYDMSVADVLIAPGVWNWNACSIHLPLDISSTIRSNPFLVILGLFLMMLRFGTRI